MNQGMKADEGTVARMIAAALNGVNAVAEGLGDGVHYDASRDDGIDRVDVVEDGSSGLFLTLDDGRRFRVAVVEVAGASIREA